MSNLDQVHESEIRVVKRHLKQGQNLFKGKNYRGAINEYRSAISHLTWVDTEVKTYFDNKSFLKTIGILQSLWIWLGKAYGEIGQAYEAGFCIEQEKKYKDLAEKCYKLYFEKERWRRERNKKFFRRILPYIIGEVLILLFGIIFLQQSRIPNLGTNFLVITFSLIVYLLYTINFRRTYWFNPTNFWRRNKYRSESERKLIEFFVNQFLFLIVPLMALACYFSLLVDLLSGIIRQSSENIYIGVIITFLMIFYIQSLIFWFSDWYEPKSLKILGSRTLF